MSDNIQKRFNELNRDLSDSWVDLSDKVRTLAADLKLKAAGTNLASEAEHLSNETSRLCDHVAKLHTDVIDLVENMEDHIPLPESVAARSGELNNSDDQMEREKIQIQRESHELRNDFKDVLKALFMWVDDPKERLKEKQ